MYILVPFSLKHSARPVSPSSKFSTAKESEWSGTLAVLRSHAVDKLYLTTESSSIPATNNNNPSSLNHIAWGCASPL